jgi:hypothetical protein
MGVSLASVLLLDGLCYSTGCTYGSSVCIRAVQGACLLAPTLCPFPLHDYVGFEKDTRTSAISKCITILNVVADARFFM